MKKIFTAIFLSCIFFHFMSCTQPPGKSENAQEVPASILSPADEPASSPQSIKVQGKFEAGEAEKENSDELINFIIGKVISLSSSLTQAVGPGDTISVRMSINDRMVVHEDSADSTITYQLILQEKLMMGKEGVIYSLKDIQRLQHSK